ncbi:MAG TPA: tetratricopeptide repeat protein [Ohtaekwangia sp.]|uniref:type IX secretion system periplasmic lipoprotein PorW/SprE n=1 Tax=Ohtaekwangia sp. TaxID=2066019 RepID=UPI002F956883
MKILIRYLIVLFVLVLLKGCSSERNTWTSKAYHNTTAHYNGYFYAREELTKVDKTIWSNLKDDYNRILRLYPALDSAFAKSYDKEIQEAIKMASIAIQRHPRSKWVDDNYILVGRARLYSMDWGNAIETFKYVNNPKLTKDKDARHRALIHLIRTFVEHKEFNNAQAAIDYVQKEDLSKANLKSLLLEKAYFYQEQTDYDNMVRSLTLAVPMLKKRDRPGRIYFIIGQVYQKLGFEAEAYNFYKKCIATNPEYEVDFYARLYMAQVTEISRSRDVNAARKSFKKLLKDGKNKDFKDKIYYEMGVFELKQKNLNEAITNLNRSVREGNNRRIDGEAYLRLGEIYYDTLHKYELSQAYYDSAIGALPKDYEGYARIKARQEILNEFVKHINTIKWQDSLLAMASLDSVQLRSRIDSAVQAKKAADEKKAGKKKKKSNRIEIDENTNNGIFDTGEDEQNASGTTQEENADWYFGNPSAMSLGQSEFKRIWGDLPLEDNWRRSQRSNANTARPTNLPEDQVANKQDEAKAPPDPVAAEYDRVNKQIPRTEEQKKEAYKKIEDAYFSLGDIYYFKLLENDNAVSSYTTLLKRFPETEYEPEVLYKLYLIFKDANPSKAETYASKLKQKYPESQFAKILVNPNYLQESSLAVEKQKVLYKTAYEHFQNKEYRAANNVIDEALALGQTSFVPNLAMLRILILGETEDINQYQFALDDFTKKYPESNLVDYAKKLLKTSQDFQLTQEKSKGIQYIRSFEEPHYFVMVYKKEEKMFASAVLEKFNDTYFRDLRLKTSNLVLNDEYTLTLVDGLIRVSSALEYIQTFNEKLPTLTELKNHKFNTFVITKDNFDIFYRTKGLDEYIQFFEKNYPAGNQ